MIPCQILPNRIFDHRRIGADILLHPGRSRKSDEDRRKSPISKTEMKVQDPEVQITFLAPRPQLARSHRRVGPFSSPLRGELRIVASEQSPRVYRSVQYADVPFSRRHEDTLLRRRNEKVVIFKREGYVEVAGFNAAPMKRMGTTPETDGANRSFDF